MKIIITENQYKRLFEEEKILNIPGLHYFNNDWNLLMDVLNSRGNPKWKISDSLYLRYNKDVTDLNNLIYVGGYLDLYDTPIKSLGNLQSVGGYLYLKGTNIKSLGELKSVGGHLDLEKSNIISLGELKSVGGYLDLSGTPLSKKYTKEEIRKMVNVGGDIYM
jgi:hypothetical protein